ncbi:MAG: O-antigen polymerase [Candidatus Solibacter sp.]|nr:O-antigen polymerase [Candidatus Solibacter sp.]
MLALQATAIALIALILTPGWLFYFDVTPKLVVLLLAAGVALVPLRRSPLSLLALLTLASLAISTALSPTPALSFYGTHWRQYGALAQAAILIFALALSTETSRSAIVLRTVSIAGAITALYGIAQYAGWDPILPASAYHIGEGIWTIVRPPSTLGYVSYFATWLLFVFFLSLALPGRFAKICAALALVAMVLTGTRAALLGVVAGTVVWLFWRGLRVPRRVLAGAFAAILVLAALYATPLGQPMRSRARWFAEDPWGGARPLLWRDSLRMGLASPLAGHGPETFTATFPHYESRELARAYPDFAHESPHNIFLDALVSQGVAGLVLLAAWCTLGFAAAWKIRDKHPQLAACLAAALAAGIVSQQFTVFTIPTSTIFFATIALAVGLAGAPAPPPRRFPLALPLLYFAARLAFADHALTLTQRDLETFNFANSAAHYAASGETSDIWYSRALLDVARKAPTPVLRVQAFQLAAVAGERAAHTAEDPFNAWYSLSSIYAARNDAAGVERCLRSAIAAHPNWFKPHWTLAQVLRFESHRDEALREAQLAVELDGGKHPEVAHTLQELLVP